MMTLIILLVQPRTRTHWYYKVVICRLPQTPDLFMFWRKSNILVYFSSVSRVRTILDHTATSSNSFLKQENHSVWTWPLCVTVVSFLQFHANASKTSNSNKAPHLVDVVLCLLLSSAIVKYGDIARTPTIKNLLKYSYKKTNTNFEQ